MLVRKEETPALPTPANSDLEPAPRTLDFEDFVELGEKGEMLSKLAKVEEKERRLTQGCPSPELRVQSSELELRGPKKQKDHEQTRSLNHEPRAC